jgi:vitamin B12 transporter
VLACLSASALSLNFSIAHAQQSASPNLLPPIEVRPSKNPDADARRITRVPKPTPTAAPARASSDGVPVVVSPTAIVTPAGQTASSVTVVTAKDIATQQYRAAPDIFATVPGLNVVQTGGPGGQTSVFMRGTNSNHTKVLIDGIDVSDPSTPNGAFDYAHLLAADIQQLEVLRGPQSGLYGSDAIGGVISIVTQKETARPAPPRRSRPARSTPSTSPWASAARRTISTTRSMSRICMPATFPLRQRNCCRPDRRRSATITTT